VTAIERGGDWSILRDGALPRERVAELMPGSGEV
jgi:hypothetical protein